MNKFDNALNVLVRDQDFREWMNKPFTIEDKVYSTNSHSIIQISKDKPSLYDDILNKQMGTKIQGFFDIKSVGLFKISVLDLKEAIEKVPLVDEVENAGTKGKCLECEGSGEVEWEYEGYEKMDDCPVCYGKGTIIEEKQRKTGRKIKADNCFINIGVFRYRTKTIEDLIKISDFLDCKVIKVINQDNPNKATLFQISEAKIFSMPIQNSDKDKVIAFFNIILV